MKTLFILLSLILWLSGSEKNKPDGIVQNHKYLYISPELVEAHYPMSDETFKEWKDTESHLNAALMILYHSELQVLSDAMSDEAAELLLSDDPFVQATAEWALSLRVGNENKNDKQVWPQENNPEWFSLWYDIPLKKRIEMDWCRQVIAAGLFDKPDKLTAKIEQMNQRIRHLVNDNSFEQQDMDMVQNTIKALETLHQQAQAIQNKDLYLKLIQQYWLEARRLLRPVVFANKQIDFDSVIFYTRFSPHHKPNVCGVLHNATYKPGGDITILHGLETLHSVKTIIGDQLPDGHIHGMDLHFDGRRVVFGYGRQLVWPPPREAHHNTISSWGTELRHAMEPVSLYEIDIDGQNLQRLTSHSVWSDTEPVYCPNDDIAFSSERSAHSAVCDFEFNDVSNTNLYLLRRNDNSIRRLTNHRDIDMTPRLLDNGLLAYLRWEYQERYFNEIHSIWTVRPDGTHADALYKQHIPSPYALREVRSVPQSNKLVAIAAGHHCYSRGPIIIVDPGGGVNDTEGMENFTPGIVPQEGSLHTKTKSVKYGGVQEVRGYYRNPYPLSETVMLASYGYASDYSNPYINEIAGYGQQVESNGFGLYLIDAYGNKELIYRDPIYCSVDVMPFKKRSRPVAIPDMVSRETNHATCIITNVYDGIHEDIEPGSIKYIRVSQHLPEPFHENSRALKSSFGHKFYNTLPGVTRWTPVREIGLVPVEADGSAHFIVPVADQASVYFQALDENFMELIRMRSSVSFQPGETRSCVGCHETRTYWSPLGQSTTLALQKEAVKPQKPVWGHTPFDYETMIQPIWDKNCIQCHSGQNEETTLDFTDRKIKVERSPEAFNQSYLTIMGPSLLGKEAYSLVTLNDRFSDSSITEPKQFGSHKSTLTKTLLEGHQGVSLTEDEWYTLVTWLDYNAPYHGNMVNKYPADGSFARRETVHWPDPWEKSTIIPSFSGQSLVPETHVESSLIVGDSQNRKIFRVDMDGNLKWEVDADACNDIHLLSNGNILVADGQTVKEIDRTGRPIMRFLHTEAIHSCQPLSNGYTLVIDSKNNHILMLNRRLELEKTFPLTVKKQDTNSKMQIRLGPGGTYFVAQGSDQLVGEYGINGEIIRQIPFYNDVFCVVPLKNGNVIMGGKGGIKTIDQNNRMSWSLEPGDIPEANLYNVLDLIWLPNGNLLVVNQPNDQYGSNGFRLFEINPQKEIVWVLPWNENIEDPSCIALSGVNYTQTSQGNYLVAVPEKQQVIIYSETSKILYQISTVSFNDMQKAQNGNLIFADGNVLKEITIDGQLFDLFISESKILSFQRLNNGQTLLMGTSEGDVIVLDSNYNKLREINTDADAGIRDWGRLRYSQNGSLFMVSGASKKLNEYTISGKKIRTISYPKKITALSTNFAGYVITGHGDELRLVSPTGHLTWMLTKEEVPEVNLTNIRNIEFRENGNLLITNSLKPGEEGIALFEITMNKKIVRKFHGETGVTAFNTF